MRSDLLDQEHEDFRLEVRQFVEDVVVPRMDRWDEERLIDRQTWRDAGKAGLLGRSVPVELGGLGETDYRFRVVIQSEIARVGAYALQSGFSTNDDIALQYVLRHGSSEQRERWAPGFRTGETIGAIALSEPQAGSDLQGITTTAAPDGDGWVLNGHKTFITSGIHADLVVVFARTDTGEGSRGFGLFVVEAGMPGFERGRKLPKMGLHAQDTAELFFRDVKLTRDHLLGEPGSGFAQLMQSLPLERLGIAIAGQMSAEAVLDWTVQYVLEREAFGRPVGTFQGLGFELADLQTQVEVSRAYVDRCIRQHVTGELDGVDAAKAKLFATQVQWKVLDAAVQMHGGHGFLTDLPIAKAFTDARIQRIYGGTNEIMKEIVHRDLLARGRERTDVWRRPQGAPA